MAIWRVTYDFNYTGILRDVRKYKVDLKGESCSEGWMAIPVKYETEIHGNFYSSATGGIVCDRAVVDALTDEMKEHIEVLPLLSEKKEVFALNPLLIIDCLNTEKSEYRWGSSGIKRVSNAVFDEEKTTHAYLFRIPQSLRTPLCTDKFRKWVEENKFTGLDFHDFVM